MIFEVIVQPTTKRAKIRQVEVDDRIVADVNEVELLEWIYRNGQNDFQPRSCPSVSEGDLVLLRGHVFRVGMIGFTKLEVAG